MKKEIGGRFKQFRESIKKSQAQLENELNVGHKIITNIERGKTFPGIPIQNYLYHRYHLNINWLLTGNGKMMISPGKDSRYKVLTQLVSQIDENDPRFEQYLELNSLMRIPVIEQVILAKLEELKLIADEEIKSFIEGTCKIKSQL